MPRKGASRSTTAYSLRAESDEVIRKLLLERRWWISYWSSRNGRGNPFIGVVLRVGVDKKRGLIPRQMMGGHSVYRILSLVDFKVPRPDQQAHIRRFLLFYSSRHREARIPINLDLSDFEKGAHAARFSGLVVRRMNPALLSLQMMVEPFSWWGV